VIVLALVSHVSPRCGPRSSFAGVCCCEVGPAVLRSALLNFRGAEEHRRGNTGGKRYWAHSAL
jgi:hypothetical protein